MYLFAYRNTERGINARSIAKIEEPIPERAPVIDIEAEAETRRIAEIEEKHAEGLRQFRRWGMPEWAIAIVAEISDQHAICPSEVAGRKRLPAIVEARRQAIYRVKAHKPLMSCVILGKWFNRDHTSVTHLIATYSEATGAPKLVGYDIEKTRARYRQSRDSQNTMTRNGGRG
jgi:chromosomal replication initiation ATPase DnaA